MDRVPGTERLIEVLCRVLAHEYGAWEGSSGATVPVAHAPIELAGTLPAARHHHVVPVLAGHVDLVSDGPARDRLVVLSRQHRRRVLAATHDLHDLVAAITRAALPALVVKGLPLAVRTTGSDAGRAIGDIDLLVDRVDLERVVGVLADAGWRRRPMRANAIDGPYRGWVRFIDNHEVVVADGRTAVEVHWRMSQSLATRDEFAALVDRSTRIEVGGVPVPVLGPVDDALFNIVHGAKHGFERLKWAVDVARCWCDLDESQRRSVHETAIRWRSERSLRLGLATVARLGLLDGCPAARDAADDLTDARTHRWVDATLDLPSGHRARRRRRNRVRAALTETWLDRARHLGEVTFPSDVLSDERVPSLLAVPAAPLRPAWRWRESGSVVPAATGSAPQSDRGELPDDPERSNEGGEPPPPHRQG